MDVAASEFFDEKEEKYNLDFKNKQADAHAKKTRQEMIDLYLSFVREYDIVSIEDPFDQDDWETYPKLTAALAGTHPSPLLPSLLLPLLLFRLICLLLPFLLPFRWRS